MPLLPRFDPPAFLADVPPDSVFYRKFSKHISDLIGRTKPGDGRGAFYNPTRTDVKVTAEKALTWMGFPRQVLMENIDRREAYRLADADVAERKPQIEYFEWKVDRNAAGKITKVTFVTETPDYYELLWSVDKKMVVKLYQDYVNPKVEQADLQADGEYNPFNRWNTTDGIMHYIHGANSFGDAIGLSLESVKSKNPFQDNYDATPGLYNNPTSADPRISFDVHMLVRKGFYVTVRNPVGLYMAAWDNSGITDDKGRPAADYWRIERGVPGMALRVVYEVPPAKGFVVGDLCIGGRPIEYGGQLAELVTVMFSVTAGKLMKR